MMCPSPRHVVSAAHLNLISGGVHERESCLGWSGACGPYAAADTTVASVTRLVRRQSTSMIIGLLPLPIGCMSLNAYLRVCLARRGRFTSAFMARRGRDRPSAALTTWLVFLRSDVAWSRVPQSHLQSLVTVLCMLIVKWAFMRFSLGDLGDWDCGALAGQALLAPVPD